MSLVPNLTSGFQRVISYVKNELTLPWARVTGAPTTATRWPTWTEVTSKPATFSPTKAELDLVVVRDTRNDNQLPSWYFTNHPRSRVLEFKFSAALGITTSGSTYMPLETTVQWSDASGGEVHQTAKGYSGEYWRTSLAGDTWSAWKRVAYREDGVRSEEEGVATALLPEGGAYQYSGGGVTGALEIALPTAVYNVYGMVRIQVSVYEYKTDEARTYELWGHNVPAAAGWENVTATVVGGSAAPDLTVRFGGDGTRQKIWIGELGTSWLYPVVRVESVTAGYGTENPDTWGTGWDVGVVTAFGTVGHTVTSSTFAPSTHTHDDRYYTESEIDTKIAAVVSDFLTANSGYIMHVTTVNHGSNASLARPPTPSWQRRVWSGTVKPNNMIDGDVYVNTSAAI